ncbi:D-glycero-alpha-D-manno-heptose 1-phosphate guanylyltransferase [Chitinophaga dinghuensis]|uniref:D-glycero-alpha-D-manno-heptose 1-phosphate guanylyltransferase n=1 Tax=Chitinophaga dinghuensis TaxID=1539050 RepID=A0A327W088_9BACT|nr:nucleotidyltransferase family protein [Chitinophaga dinghuensis]RAJ82172.1 D-glycero-alpha-D-manno-heptose 1-phosphate guanylyltransferase [Chitinophaga dinghuensis]
MTTECIVLAGGLGTRLRSVVADKPKCMAPVGDQPFLYYLLHYLHQQGITHAILSLGYKSEQVIDWCNSQKLPLRISFAIEPEPLGTGGGIVYALGKVEGNNVFIVNGDTYFDVNFMAFDTFHQAHHSQLSLALKPMVQFDRYGTVTLDDNALITAFQEKQFMEAGLINGGVYLTSASYLKGLQLPEKFSFEKEVLEPMAASQQLYGFISDTYFIDIGIPEDYQAAARYLPYNH